jgi:hypothetical protein
VGCAQLGFTDRVLWRVQSPTEEAVVVCQEIPAFDGPGYDLRLERSDGTLIRPLYQIGDGDPCSEVVWSDDGHVLAVLSSHVARVAFIDVKAALDHPDAESNRRVVSFADERGGILGQNVRFVPPLEFEIDLCPFRLGERRSDGTWSCTGPAERRRTLLPSLF